MPTITAAQLAELVGGTLYGDSERVLRSVAPLEHASSDSVTFLANVRYAALLSETAAGVVLVSSGVRRDQGDVIETADPYAAFVKTLVYFHPEVEHGEGIHESAVIADDVQIGANVLIGPCCVVQRGAKIGDNSLLEAGVFVGEQCVIGNNCRIHPHATIRHHVQIGNRVTIHSGTVIGADGFGFAFESGRYQKIPQIGTVIIDDDVEIGANTTVDRATMGETRIGEGTKIDNLVQIAHNVRIGRHCVIAAQAGISGSTVLGDYCRVGGQAGFVGHLKIGDGAAFGAQSGISHDVRPGEVLSGSPGRPHSVWKRIEAALPRLPELLRRVRRLEERVGIGSGEKERERA
ncbi:UDP-3-O-(3-hydroxymyristoyl)glucosamine N-acyltransferase [bacterium]|nr:UDP-3-O-(3-hydroxymyristoyl)glucosamine N-acyltransferase [bacterium]